MFSVLRRTSTYFVGSKACLFSPLEMNCNKLPKCAVTQSLRLKYTLKLPSWKEGSQTSRFHPGSYIELTEERIASNLDSKTFMNNEDWNNFKIDLTTDAETVTEENFSSIVMNCLLSKNKLDLAHGLIKYLENSGIEPNFITYLKYVSLCSRNRKQVDQELILKTLNKVKFLVDNSPVLDMKTAEYTIEGLCATNRWKDSFEYLKKIPSKPSLTIRSTLASAAVRNGDETLAWDILRNWIKEGEMPSNRAIEEFFLVALQKQKENPCKADLFFQQILQYIQEKGLVVSIDVIKVIEQFFKCHRLKWNISYTKVNRKGHCEKCGHTLKLLDLTNDEFNYLKNSFLKSVVKKSDVFINTTTKEFNYFCDFLERFKPFHVVVDGLNAAYSGLSAKSPKNLASQLLFITKTLAGKSRKVLILGRWHMRNWPSISMQKISERAKLFYTDNISQDDPFVIYAALASGPHTLFLSSDLMRDHISRLDDPKLIQLFHRWQLSHQIFVTIDEKDQLKFIEPLKHSINVQGSMKNGWHIPYDDKITLDPYEELNNWLCVDVPASLC